MTSSEIVPPAAAAWVGVFQPGRRAVFRRALGLFAAVASTASLAQTASPAMVNMERLRAVLADRSAIVFDIREPAEHATGVAAGARLVPLSELKQRLDLIPRDQPVLLVCNTQNRSAALTATLRERGWTQVQYVEGGMSGWVRRGWATVPPSAAASAAAEAASVSGR